MKFSLLFSCIFVLCLAKIEPGLGLEEIGKDLSPEIDDFSSENEDFPPEIEDELEDNISDEDDDYDEEDNFPNARIAHGRKAKKNSVPYHVALTVTTPDEGTVVRKCCAVIVTATRILSLKTCVKRGDTASTASVRVHLGVRNIYNEGERGRVTLLLNAANQVTVGTVVEGTGTADEFSLIKLVNPIPFSRRIRPIRLPTAGSETNSYVGHLVKISGFGDYRRHMMARKIRFAEGKLRPVSKCDLTTLPLHPTTHVCFSGRKGRAACTGDLGCPITTKCGTHGTTLLALVSEVVTECGGKHPRENTIGVRVVNALNFIATG